MCCCLVDAYCNKHRDESGAVGCERSEMRVKNGVSLLTCREIGIASQVDDG